MRAASISALTPSCIHSVGTAAVQQWLNNMDSCGQKTHTVSLWIRHGRSSFCCFLSSAHRNSCHMPSASVYFQGVKWGACGRNSLCFVYHCPIGYPREGGWFVHDKGADFCEFCEAVSVQKLQESEFFFYPFLSAAVPICLFIQLARVTHARGKFSSLSF